MLVNILKSLFLVRHTDAKMALLQAENAALRAKLKVAELEIKQADSIADYWYGRTIELAARQSMKVMMWSKN